MARQILALDSDETSTNPEIENVIKVKRVRGMMYRKRLATVLALSLSAMGSAENRSDIAAPDMRGATANAELWPASSSPQAITSPATEAAIDRLLQTMTLEQKVGQLIQADISAIKPDDLIRYPLGSILAGGNSGPYGDERASAEQWRKLVAEFRAVSRKSGAGIPILFGVDAVHGHSNLPGATIFPHNIGLGAAHDPDLIQRIGKATAAEISGSGIEWTFAPTLAVPQDLRWGRSYEGYSADPALVARYAEAMTLGLQGPLVAEKPLDADRVAATAKHFLADGGTVDGRDQGDARIGEEELIAKHAQGYPASINAGALTVMASFSSWNGTKHHGNKSLLTDVLKGRMGFAGLIVGDWNGHGQIPGCSATQCPQAINAGLDLFMAPDSWKGLFDSTLAAAADGQIPIARIDDAVRRILRVKFKLGLMGNTLTQRGTTSLVGATDHLALAREAVSKSLVLLKNEKSTLPIRNGARVLIAGSGADNMAMQAGGWTISWQGTDTKASDFPNGHTIGRAISQAVTAHGGRADIAPDGHSTMRPDVAVIVLGEKPYAEFEGDVPDLAFRVKPEEEALIARLKSQGAKIVILFLSGRPMFTGKLINQADAFVAGWLPGTQALGVSDVLVAGARNKPVRDFTGRLPFAWPADGRSPIDKPLFAMGYGLSYAKAASVPQVNEDPVVSLSMQAHETNYMVRGKSPAPWRLDIDGAVSARAVDISAQEDARQFNWNREGMLSIYGPPVDLRQELEAGSALVLDWRVDRPAIGVIKVALDETALDIGRLAAASPAGTVLRTQIPLRCFSDAGAKLSAVGVPLRFSAPKGFVATLRNVRVEAGEGDASCPQEAE